MKKILILLAAAAILAACETVSYYGQAVSGQLYIMSHREEIEQLILNEDTDPDLRDKLALILEIRAFAERELGLPVKESFSTYVDLERPYVVWNVFATPEFSMNPVRWCYPIAGCVSYRGYFKKGGAEDFADSLEDKDYDVYMGGVAAYSTLGWFSDPLLNTVMGREDHQLASLVFHELAHQVVYVPGDTEFNESFATAVEQEGLRRWLETSGRETEESDRIMDGVVTNLLRREEFVALVQGTVSELKLLYGSELPPDQMRREKRRIIDRLRDDYEVFKTDWGGYDGYDAWFDKDLNNAQLNTVATYYQWVPAFSTLLEDAGGDLRRFYGRVNALSRMGRGERRELLERRLELARGEAPALGSGPVAALESAPGEAN